MPGSLIPSPGKLDLPAHGHGGEIAARVGERRARRPPVGCLRMRVSVGWCDAKICRRRIVLIVRASTFKPPFGERKRPSLQRDAENSAQIAVIIEARRFGGSIYHTKYPQRGDNQRKRWWPCRSARPASNSRQWRWYHQWQRPSVRSTRSRCSWIPNSELSNVNFWNSGSGWKDMSFLDFKRPRLGCEWGIDTL